MEMIIISFKLCIKIIYNLDYKFLDIDFYVMKEKRYM
jgi:hypothetical protein